MSTELRESYADLERKVADRTKEPATLNAIAAVVSRSLNLDEILPLTEREAEVLSLVARGLSNQEIADKLVISERTVRMHVSSILGKLHLASRT